MNTSQSDFEAANAELTNKTNVILQRQPNHAWVNQYNTHLLRAWNANVDIQYIVDEYACVVYIISYISKSEHEIGQLLDVAQKEAFNGNLDTKEALKQIGSIYLHSREVSAQEPVYRLTGMHLTDSSHNVIFIPIGEYPMKTSKPLSLLKKLASR